MADNELNIEEEVNNIIQADDVGQTIDELLKDKEDITHLLVIGTDKNNSFLTYHSKLSYDKIIFLLEVAKTMYIDEYFNEDDEESDG